MLGPIWGFRYSRGEDDRRLVRLGANVSETFSGKLHPSWSSHVNVPDAGWSNLKPKQTVPFLLSSHGLGMWAMADYYGEAFMGTADVLICVPLP